jgi:hypothetical protein
MQVRCNPPMQVQCNHAVQVRCIIVFIILCSAPCWLVILMSNSYSTCPGPVCADMIESLRKRLNLHHSCRLQALHYACRVSCQFCRVAQWRRARDITRKQCKKKRTGRRRRVNIAKEIGRVGEIMRVSAKEKIYHGIGRARASCDLSKVL